MKLKLYITMLAAAFLATGCINKDTKFAWAVGEGGSKSIAAEQASKVKVPARAPIKVPPQLLGKIEVPHAEQIAVVKTMPKAVAVIVAAAGTQVALDAKVYPQAADQVFSGVLNAMTGLNLPVQSVDSPSGTITTDWIRKNSKSASVMNMLGGSDVLGVRYRFVTRVLRQVKHQDDGSDVKVTRFEIHTVAQAYKHKHWVNTRLARHYAKELFSRVDEEIGKL